MSADDAGAGCPLDLARTVVGGFGGDGGAKVALAATGRTAGRADGTEGSSPNAVAMSALKSSWGAAAIAVTIAVPAASSPIDSPKRR